MDAADSLLVVGVAEWLFGKILLDVRPKPCNQRSLLIRPVCGRADDRDVSVDGMLRRTNGKSACYAGELVVPEPLNAVR